MKKRAPKKFKKSAILIDTSVWLDLAKDYRQLPILNALEELVKAGTVELIIPQLVLDEFARNKARIIEDSGKSLSGVLKRVKEAVSEFATADVRDKTLAVLNDIGHRIAAIGDSISDQVRRIEKLFAEGRVISTSDQLKVRAAQRGIDKRAPFHRQRNGIDDAILIETYADYMKEDRDGFAFITHNFKDFSGTDHRLPHPDLGELFGDQSAYSISLAETLNAIAPDLLDDFKFELEYVEEPRRLTEIVDSIGELFDKVWCNRHWNTRVLIDKGKIKLVEKETFPVKDHSKRPVQRDVWEGALKAAKKVEEKYGLENLGPWSDFEWGMLNGKLSALRWVLGDEWDMLDT